jgi:uncharacterized membrane protein YeaQ/YmgE (transglycosylase-associated protein family)
MVITLVIGGLIGWAASRFMGTDAQMGIIANIIIGLVGAAVGHWLAGIAGIGQGNQVVRIIIGILGACLLIWLLSALKIRF